MVSQDKVSVTDTDSIAIPDLVNLQNQLSKEQPGCCDSYDQREKKRAERNMRKAQGLEASKTKSDAKIAN